MGKRVLIVDDDDDTRNVYSAMLRYAGYEIVEAPTGEIGLSLAESYQPDVIVLDIGLPGINGWEVCHKLKSMPSTAAAKIVIVTAHAFIDEGRRAEECGAEAFLTKPASPLLIRSYVARLIGPSSLN
jgi:two-component system cell cycle response regulator DivK